MTRLHRRPSPLPRVLAALIGAFVLLQLVPYGRAHANPPAQVQPHWANTQTQALFMRACADCHSNKTTWPWYSNIAPVSWFVQKHVDEGRSYFNVNTPGFGEDAGQNAAKEVREGGMPLPTYLPMHPSARLTPAEKETLIRGLEATFGSEEKGLKGKGSD